MKMEKTTTAFKPITITLEKQEEVNVLFAMINHDTILQALDIDEDGNAWDDLHKFIHDAVTHNTINDLHKGLSKAFARFEND